MKSINKFDVENHLHNEYKLKLNACVSWTSLRIWFTNKLNTIHVSNIWFRVYAVDYIINILVSDNKCSNLDNIFGASITQWFHKPESDILHWVRDKTAAISQIIFLNAFPWMKMHEFRLRFHWSLFLSAQLSIFQHWFRWWLDTDQWTNDR